MYVVAVADMVGYTLNKSAGALAAGPRESFCASVVASGGNRDAQYVRTLNTELS
ncbi:hypothetical protein SAMN05192543_102784 [Paraburkholderia megapolitana]|uniref:Uncharacterized protein n=1 Tax=Paraburkholderia megapolitana TaxID=420953 RepID=A0A1I3H082_9BURK|nr:hypothetical protein SAMN05192543_102784 [Paraburkholderia megapolitana]